MRKAAAALLAVALVLVTAVVVYLRSAAFEQRLLLEAQRTLERQGLLLKSNRLRLQWHGLSASLIGVRLSAKEAADLPPLLIAARIDAGLDASALLWRGEVVLDRITVESPRLYIVFLSNGRSNLPRLAESKGPPPDYRILRLDILRGAVQVDDFAQRFTATVPALSGEMLFSRLMGKYRLALRAPGVRVALDGRAIAIRDVEMALRTPPAFDSFRIDALRLATDYGRLQLTGDAGAKLPESALQFQASGPAPGPLQSDITATGKVSFPGYDARRYRAEARLIARGQLSADATVRASGDIVKASIHTAQLPGVRARGDVQWESNSRVAGRLSVEVHDAARAASLYHGRLPPLAGRVAAQVRVSGFTDNPQATVEIERAALDVGQFRGVTANGLLHATLREVRLERMEVQAAGQRGTVEGLLSERALNLRAQLEKASIAALLSLIPGQNLPLDGVLDATAHLTGSPGRPLADFALRAYGVRGWEEALGNVRADGSWQQGRLSVPRAVVEKGSGSVSASAQYESAGGAISLAAEARQFPLQRFASASLTGSAKLRGTLDNPQGEFSLTAPDVVYQGKRAGSVGISGTLRDRNVFAAVKVPAYGAEANVRAPLNAATPLEFDASLRDSDLEALAGLAGRSLQGLTGRLTGSARGVYVGDPAKTEASGELTAFAGQWNKLPFRLNDPLRFALRQSLAKLDPVRVQLGRSSIELAGELPLLANAAIPGIAANATLRLEDAAELFPQQLPSAAGELRVDGVVRGSFDKPHVEARLALRNGTLQPAALPQAVNGVELDGTIAGEEVRLTRLEASYASGKISGSAVAPLHLFLPAQYLSLPARDPARVSLRADAVPLDAFPGVPPKLRGAFSLELDATAPRAGWEAVEASLRVPELKLRAGDFDIGLVRPAAATLRKGLLEVQQLELRGPETQFQTRGYIRTAAPYAANLSTAGTVDLALAGAFLPEIRIGGAAAFQFAIRGSLAQPSMAGFLEWKDGAASWRNPALEASGVEARVGFAGNKITLERFRGELNGGSLEGSGALTAELKNETFEWKDVDLRWKVSNVYIEPLKGLQGLTEAALRIQGSSAGLAVTGEVTALESSYNEPVLLEQALLASLRGSTVIAIEQQATELPVSLDIAAKTLTPLQINNNLLRAAVDADLRLRGTAANPGLTGRLTIDEGGQLFLNERTYTVERGGVLFTDERRIAPVFDVAARTRVNDYDITLRLQGPPGRELQTTLLSDPPLPEQDVLAVLATGRRLEELEGAGSTVIREQVLSYLAGSLGGGITQKAGRAIGLSQVRIEPSLIASETEPTARLTLGQDFTRQLGLVYSMNLRDSSDQIWIGKYDITRRFTTRVLRQSDETYRFQFQHDLQFGGRKPRTVSKKKTLSAGFVTNIAVLGDSPFPAKEIQGWLGLSPGSRYDFFRLRKGMDRIRHRHAGQSYLEARVTNTRVERPGEIGLTIDVRTGPRVEFVFEGWDPSRAGRKALQETWRGASFDALRRRAVESKAAQLLASDGYLRAKVDVKIREQEGRKSVLLEVMRGLRYKRLHPRFLGVAPEREAALRKLLEPGDVAYTDPTSAAALVRDHFYRHGFLDAALKAPRMVYDDGLRTAVALFEVNVGPLYRAGEIRFQGAARIPAAQLRARLPFLAGAVYTPDLDRKAIDALLQAYGDFGFAGAELQQRLRRDPLRGLVDIDFLVKEGPQRVVKEVHVAGNQYTSDRLIRTQMAVQPGDVLYDGKVAEARRSLYSTGAFRIADIEVSPVESPAAAGKTLVRLTANVEETRPFEIRYGGFYDTERGAGGIIDVTNRNMLGSARAVGFRTRYDSTLREARVYYDQPTLLRFPVKTTATVFARRESNPGFFTDRMGGSLNGEFRFRRHFRLDFGYRLEQTHTFEKDPDPFFPLDARLWLAPVTGAVSRDTRDDILDASRGSFLSNAFEISPKLIDRQLTYWKYYGQYFFYRSFGGMREVPWAAVVRPRFTYAGGVRLGLAGGLGGQDVTYSERFFAGGSNTVRGFDRNFLGPLDFDGTPLGGNAVAIVNQELRFPFYKMVDGAAFFDAGNVSRLVSRFGDTDWRKSAGAGLRLRTPYVLLRVDYGWKLGRRPGESGGQFFFSIGQAF
ncbi:MAG: translocation/assembly module TamB domain-containing protein [Bryobacterales bacterium]|nr:translocation/assembly module TamB domain-containing protein [Bryobacterales bacterium]